MTDSDNFHTKYVFITVWIIIYFKVDIIENG